MSCLSIEGHGEGEEGRAIRSSEFPDGLVAVGVEASTFVGGDGWVLYPESESAVCANRGDEVGMELWMEPLDLYLH